MEVEKIVVRGLKQSGRDWHNVLHNYLKSEKFEQSLNDSCMFTKMSNESKIIIIVWVDDIIIAGSNVEVLEEMKSSLSQRFKMKDLEKLSYFLGMKFKFGGDSVEMNQAKFVEKVLDKFGMSDCNPKATPCDLSANKLSHGDSIELADPKLYRAIVGSLIYVMTATRPDLCHVVTLLSQNMNMPTKAHLSMAKCALKCLKSTVNYGLKFTRSSTELKLEGFCDSDWGSSEDRRSVTGYGFRLCDESPLISWKSKKQPTVALSICEAEYIALAAAVQEAKFLRRLLADFQGKRKAESVTLHVDNQGAIALAKNPVHHQCSKHIDIKYHFVRNEILNEVIKLKYVPSQDNVADLFIKPVSKSKLQNVI